MRHALYNVYSITATHYSYHRVERAGGDAPLRVTGALPHDPIPRPLSLPRLHSPYASATLSVPSLIASCPPAVLPASLHRWPLLPDDTTNNTATSLISRRSRYRYVCRTHARMPALSVPRLCLTVVFVGKKGFRGEKEKRKRSHLLPPREKNKRQGEGRHLAAAHNFVSRRVASRCIACTKEGTTLSGRGMEEE